MITLPSRPRLMLGLALFWFAWAGMEMTLGLASSAVQPSHAARLSMVFLGFGLLCLGSRRNLLAKAAQAAPSPAVDS